MSIGSISLSWWRAMQPDGKRPNNGALARLRRSSDLPSAMMEEVTVDLVRYLEPECRRPRQVLFERGALIAAVLAHVRDHDERKVATVAGAPRPGSEDQRVVSPLRFQRLFSVRRPEECLPAFRRLVAQLGNTVNVADLSESAFDWPDELRGDNRRTRWAYDYYGASAAAPETDAA